MGVLGYTFGARDWVYKEGYYLALRQTQVTIRTDAHNWQPWLSFFLRTLQQQMKRLAIKVEREKIVPAVLAELSLRIIERARKHGRVTISDIVKLTGANKNTLKQHFRQLVAQGHLALPGGGRGAWYALP
jgi:Fic family protein